MTLAFQANSSGSNPDRCIIFSLVRVPYFSTIFLRKDRAAVVEVRRAWATHTNNTINPCLEQVECLRGLVYWNIGMGLQEDDVKSDAEGLETMKNPGHDMTWV